MSSPSLDRRALASVTRNRRCLWQVADLDYYMSALRCGFQVHTHSLRSASAGSICSTGRAAIAAANPAIPSDNAAEITYTEASDAFARNSSDAIARAIAYPPASPAATPTAAGRSVPATIVPNNRAPRAPDADRTANSRRRRTAEYIDRLYTPNTASRNA